MKLVKYLSRCEVDARRKCADIIKEGNVTVNGITITNPMTDIDETCDSVKCNSKTVKINSSEKKLYVLFYKPEKCVTTLSDELGRPTVMDYLKKIRGWKTLFPIGRLDYDTEGFLLLTNDGDYSQAVQHPSNEIIKIYQAKVKGVPSELELAKLTKGIKVDGKSARCISARLLKNLRANCWIELQIISGQNRVVRKICDYIQHSVLRLVRVGIGGFLLKDIRLKPGQFLILNSIHKDLVFKNNTRDNLKKYEKIQT